MKLEVKPGYALCVVIAAKGYPDAYGKGDVITFPPTLPPATFIYHAGTAKNPAGQIVTNGGRVLGVTAMGPTIDGARAQAYEAVAQLGWPGMQHRTDIAVAPGHTRAPSRPTQEVSG